jgi:hypothetical protein
MKTSRNAFVAGALHMRLGEERALRTVFKCGRRLPMRGLAALQVRILFLLVQIGAAAGLFQFGTFGFRHKVAN